MKIWQKFIGSSLIVAGLVSGLMGGSALISRQAERSAEISRDQTIRALTISLNLQLYLRDQTLALKDFILLNRNSLDLAEYEKSLSKFMTNINELKVLIPDSTDLAIIDKRHQFLVRLANEISNNPTTLEKSQQDLRAINSFNKDIDFYLDLLTKNAQKQDELAKKQLEIVKQNTSFISQLGLIIILLVFIGQFVFILLPVIKSIQKLYLGAITIGAGNLDYRFDIHTKDEIAQLADEFNQMAKKLSEFYHSLELKVIDRTAELVRVNQNLETEIAERKLMENALRESEERERHKNKQIEQTLHELKKAQSQLIQTEKMSSLGQLVAGIAHEINNPVNFIYGNLNYTNQYIEDLLAMIALYQKHYPQPPLEIQEHTEEIEFNFLLADLPKMLESMKGGAERIRQIVLSLRNFSRLDESDMKLVDIHTGIESTLLILQSRLKNRQEGNKIKLIKEYGNLPEVECYAGQLNQVFLNILNNAIDALESDRSFSKAENNYSGQIKIRTLLVNSTEIAVIIADNGAGMTEEVKNRLFDPFFTTKPVGKGTGLGLSISYQIIVEKHGGILRCESELGKGTEFWLQIPIKQTQKSPSHDVDNHHQKELSYLH